MTNKLNRILKPNIDQDELDSILEGAIQAKFDAELKQDLAESLRQEYQISKDTPVIDLAGRKRKNRLFFLTALAAGIALFILALNVFDPFAGNAQKLASSYLESSEIYHSGAVKGSAGNLDIRMQAIQAFNTRKYAEAERYFSRIPEKTEEDIFYSGISSLYDGKYEEAIAKLQLIVRSDSVFKTEASWYLALAYTLHGDETAAKTILSPLKDSTWNQEKIRTFLNALD